MIIENIIKLDRNENPLGCSSKALAALAQMPATTVSTYPSPTTHSITEKLATKLKVKHNQLFLSNGSDYIFSLLLTAFSQHTNKNILIHDYAFCSYGLLANTLKIPVCSVAINSDWQVNINHFIQACTPQTSIIFLANPNNPTGGLIRQQEIEILLDNIPKSTLVVIDEAYFEFALSQFNYNSIDWLEKYPNLVITRTFSKLYGLAGLRLGYAIAASTIIDKLQQTQLPFNVNQAALTAANASLDDEEFIKLSLQTNAEGMLQLREGFEKLNINYLPSAGNFITFDCQEDCAILYSHLSNKGIMVRPLSPYNMNRYMRVTIGTKFQNNRFLDALGHYYKMNNLSTD